MTKQKDSLSSYKGRYLRTLGKHIDSAGKPVPKKFLLGTDRAAAEIANRRLERLWQCVVERHQKKVVAASDQYEAHATIGEVLDLRRELDRVTGHDADRDAVIEHGPVWLPETLAIAEAVRAGRHEVLVEPSPPDGYFDFAQRMRGLEREYGSVIAFRPASANDYEAARDHVKKMAAGLIRDAEKLSGMVGTELADITGKSLHEALDAYAKFVLTQGDKDYSRNEAERTGRLKESHQDVPLSRFGMSGLERMAAHWNGRPLGKKSGRPIAVDTVVGMLKTTRRFIAWLHRSDQFEWSKPVDFEVVLAPRASKLLTDEEIGALGEGVKTWTVEELKVLYRWASDRDRLLILLGLNCGFSHAEIGSLRTKEIEVDRIKRIRRKSKVAGIWPLWPQTVKALAWFRKVTREVQPEQKDMAIISETGRPLDRQRISNSWQALFRRIRKRDPNFRFLSFKYLRKTSADMIRSFAGGEVMKVFLAHGKPVDGDPLSEVYSNKPFDKVAIAVEKMGLMLGPVFRAAPDAFTQGSLRMTAKKPAVWKTA